MRLFKQAITCLLFASAMPALGQQYLGPAGPPTGAVVDRGVSDISANAASMRVAQPGLGQFGVGSLLIDRHAVNPFEPNRFDPFAGDSRVSHRFLMRAPGVTAMMNQTDYIGPSPRGGFVRNGLTFDGSAIQAISPDTIFVLTPELLHPQRQQRQDPTLNDHPSRVQPITPIDFDAYMRSMRYTGQRVDAPFKTNLNAHIAPELARDPNYVHPEIIERRKRWKAEREAEEAAKAKPEATEETK